METLKIEKIVKTAPANYGKTRVAFTAKGKGETVYSGFFESVPPVGHVLEGEVEVVEKDGKTYYNFNFPKRQNDLRTELIALEGKFRMELEPIRIDLQRIIKHLSGEDRLDLTSDGEPLPDFEPEGR